MKNKYKRKTANADLIGDRMLKVSFYDDRQMIFDVIVGVKCWTGPYTI